MAKTEEKEGIYHLPEKCTVGNIIYVIPVGKNLENSIIVTFPAFFGLSGKRVHHLWEFKFCGNSSFPPCSYRKPVTVVLPCEQSVLLPLLRKEKVKEDSARRVRKYKNTDCIETLSKQTLEYKH